MTKAQIIRENNMELDRHRITIIGAGTIGLSFAALHLMHSTHGVTIFDTRPDLEEYVHRTLPTYITPSTSAPAAVSRLTIATSLPIAVASATIIQEAGPENLPFKRNLWPQVETHCPPTALLWSSTSGIPASAQAQDMRDPSRLLVCHPYNPPHIMPLLEIVPSPSTAQSVIDQTLVYWKSLGRSPVVVKRECTGFVANRLAFALFREAIHLVATGVVGVEEVDRIVESSMGPRWTVAGPFKSYHAGGGEGGLEGFFKNIGGTVQGCWDDAGVVNVGDGWEQNVFEQTKEAYGVVDVGERDKITKRVLEVVGEEKGKGKERSGK